MEPGNYNFPSHVAEDTVKARTFTITRTPQGGSAGPEDLTNATVHFTVRDELDLVAYEATDGAGLSHNGALGVVTLDAFNAPSKAGVHNHDLEINFPDGRRHTYIKGTLPVTQGQTRQGQTQQ